MIDYETYAKIQRDASSGADHRTCSPFQAAAHSESGTDPPSALPRQSRQISEGKLTRQTAPGRRSRQPNLTPQPPLPLWLHCDATTSVFLHLQFRYLTG